jgi:hypothetical protein
VSRGHCAQGMFQQARRHMQGIDLDDGEWAAFASGIERLALQKERSQHFRPFQVPARTGRPVPGRRRGMLACAGSHMQPGLQTSAVCASGPHCALLARRSPAARRVEHRV